MRKKHRNDKNHGKNGFVAGNVRYRRSKPGTKMGKARMSSCWT
jgi:hypothetical protein